MYLYVCVLQKAYIAFVVFSLTLLLYSTVGIIFASASFFYFVRHCAVYCICWPRSFVLRCTIALRAYSFSLWRVYLHLCHAFMKQW